MDDSPSRASVHGISQARILSGHSLLQEIFLTQEGMQVSRIAGSFFTVWTPTVGIWWYGVSFPGDSDGKESARNVGDLDLIAGPGRCPGGGHGNLLQYSCLENRRGQRSLEGCSPWGRKESVLPKWLSVHTHTHSIFGGFWESRRNCMANAAWMKAVVRSKPAAARLGKPWANTDCAALCGPAFSADNSRRSSLDSPNRPHLSPGITTHCSFSLCLSIPSL